MVSTDKSTLSSNSFLLVTTILAVCSLVVALAGACALKVLQGAWWIVVYELIIVSGNVLVFMRGVLAHYRLAMLTMLAISIPLLTIQIDYILQYSRPAQLNRMAANAYAAGYIGLVIIQYIWVLVIGSEPKSYLGQLAHDDRSMQSSLVEPQFYSEKQAAHIITHNNSNTIEPNTMNPGSSLQDFSQVFIPHAITTSNDINNQQQQQQQQQHQEPQQEQQQISEVVPTTNAYPETPSVPQNNTSNLSQLSSDGADFKEKVEAIHTYQANPQDPNELDFVKGEVVEIVDRKGNWWQARKSDGRIGIIPSNYFRPLQG